MTIIGGKFTTAKRNLVTYVEIRQYELLRQLALQNGRSISAETAIAVTKHLEANKTKLGDAIKEQND